MATTSVDLIGQTVCLSHQGHLFIFIIGTIDAQTGPHRSLAWMLHGCLFNINSINFFELALSLQGSWHRLRLRLHIAV